MATKMIASVETITPQGAEHILSMNTTNRAIKIARVRRYASALRRGDWQLNGETIKIGSEGRLLDGQHRLRAIVEAQVPMTTLVVRNASDDVFRTIDAGANRSPADALHIEGFKNSKTLAAAAAGYIALERGGDFSAINVTTQTIEETVTNHPVLVPLTSLYVGIKTGKIAPAYTISVCARGAELHSVDDAEEFLRKLTDGDGLQRTSSILLLRERLLADKANRKSHLTRDQRTALTAKAWNYFIRRKPLTILRWSIDESFPEII